MKNKNRLLKILLFSVLIIASLVTYLSYGVKEKMTSTKLDFDNNRSRITEILTSKSILLDMKIQRRKGNYDLLHYYVKGDDIDQLNVYDDYSLKDVFTDYIYNLEDENNHETKGIKYYVYDKTDEKIFFTNSKKNLKKAFETQDKKILNDYQWYATIDYDENGNISLEGNQTSDWEGAFYNTSFDQLFKNNYLDEGYSDIINQITINNPTNIKVLIAIVAILYILQVYGVNTSALVAGVGAFSLVIGLAFQDVLKDLLVGATIILESQFAIGEIVEINGFKGEVISLTLKTTRLKSYKGEVKIIANRNIGEITNYSLDNVLVRVIASVSYESDNKKVEKVLNELIEKLNTSIPELKSKITIEGIDSLSDSSVDYLLTAKSSVKNEFVVKRKILKEIKNAFDQNGIEIPYPQLEVHNEK